MFRELSTRFQDIAYSYPEAAGHVLIREALEDTVLTVPNPVGEEGSKSVPIPKGTQVGSYPFSSNIHG